MPKIEKHPPGTFCWMELATTDQPNAKIFYSALFGWTPLDSPMGPDGYYTMFQLNGFDAAAAYTMASEERASAPPHWNIYVAVESADETAKLAGELGGKVLVPPFDVMSYGRMAVIQDPPGTIFCIWQAKDNHGTAVDHENGTFCWADLSTTDPDRAKKFYEALFGWKVGPADNYPPNYQVIQNGDKVIGGIGPAHNDSKTAPYWMLFFQIGDVDGVAAKAKELGGTEHLAPTSMGGSRLSILADPQGAMFAIIRPPQRS
jgi:predicted enzyme related to lactoylglutathione lyase